MVMAGSRTSHPRPERVDVGWDTLLMHFVHPTKIIIIETMFWIGRPVSATELKEISEGAPDLSAFSFHLKQLVRLGTLEVVAKCKARKSQSPNKETFFYFSHQDQWAEPIARLNDPGDFLTQVALAWSDHRHHCARS